MGVVAGARDCSSDRDNWEARVCLQVVYAFYSINDRIVAYPDPIMRLTDRVNPTARLLTITLRGTTLFPNLIRLTRGEYPLEVHGTVAKYHSTRGSR